MLDEVTDDNYQGEMGLLHKGSNEEYVWNTGNPLRYLLVFSLP